MFNGLRTAALMAAITALFGVIGASIGGGLSGLFSTHPRTEERIRRLLSMPGLGQAA